MDYGPKWYTMAELECSSRGTSRLAVVMVSGRPHDSIIPTVLPCLVAARSEREPPRCQVRREAWEQRSARENLPPSSDRRGNAIGSLEALPAVGRGVTDEAWLRS